MIFLRGGGKDWEGGEANSWGWEGGVGSPIGPIQLPPSYSSILQYQANQEYFSIGYIIC